MSQITRCPQCQTRFKVVDDQLRISDGWVRCGKCKSVFDALAHLVQRPDAPVVGSAPAAVSAPNPIVAAPPTLEAPIPHTQPAAVPPPLPSAAPAAVQASAIAKAPEMSAPAVVSRSAEAAAVVVTGNSMQVDARANVPELSVLVFPRRGGFGDSGYVDSSWMSTYEKEALVSKAESPAKAAAPGALSADADDERAALESHWQDAIDHRPEAVRNSTADFSAKDELAELKAREERLLDAIAEKKAKSVTKTISLSEATARSAAPATTVLEPAPAPQADARTASSVDADVDEKKPLASNQKALNAPEIEALQTQELVDADEAPVAAKEALFATPEVVDRQIEPGKVEPALAASEVAVADEPSFVRQAKRKAFWAQPWVLGVSLLCAVLLLAGLLFQMALMQRDRLAVLHPEWRPTLEKACHLAGCQVALPRQLSSVAIDSTSFNPVGPRQFKLTVVLRNTAAYAMAVPSLELSLKDAAEKLVLRRVLSPAEMNAPAALSAQGEWTAVVAIKVADNGDDVVGYRIVAFYP